MWYFIKLDIGNYQIGFYNPHGELVGIYEVYSLNNAIKDVSALNGGYCK